MPEPNRPAFLIEDRIAGLQLRQLIEQQAVVRITCDACHHAGRWTAGDIERRLGDYQGLPLREIGLWLRCSVCKSEWVRVAQERQPTAASQATQET
jgi:hypothetical protein